MKIIHLVLGKANPERMNGVNKVAYQLTRNQHAAGYDVAVWGLSHDPTHNYPSRNFTTRLFQRHRFRLDAELVRSLMTLPADAIVHLHGVFIPVFDRIARLLKKQDVPYLITPHGSLAKAALARNAWMKYPYFQLISKPSLKHACKVQMLGEQESADLFDLAPSIRQVLIPNGQDLNEIPHLPQRFTNKKPVFVYCGRLDSYHKGLDLMLQAFLDIVKNKGVDARLLMIGDGKDREELAGFCVKHQLQENVIFCGARYGKEKWELLAQGDFFLHTSRMEGFPVAVLEAAALGIPCITTVPTSMNRYLTNYQAGFPIENLEVSTISAVMANAAQCFNQPALETMSENARRMIKEAFDWQRIAAQLINVYGKAL